MVKKTYPAGCPSTLAHAEAENMRVEPARRREDLVKLVLSISVGVRVA